MNGMYKCEQCGKSNDLLVAFTKYPVCGKCTRKSNNKAKGKK